METKDHMKIAVYCWNKEHGKSVWYHKAAFVLGNIEPDMNPFTYFRGGKLKGHHFAYTGSVMQSLAGRLESRRSMNGLDYFRLGVLMHYAADAFTLPHNREFQGTVKEHALYEHRLHRRSIEVMRAEKVPYAKMDISGEIYRNIETLHAKYEQEEENTDRDLKYIFCSLHMIMALVNGKTVHGKILKRRYCTRFLQDPTA